MNSSRTPQDHDTRNWLVLVGLLLGVSALVAVGTYFANNVAALARLSAALHSGQQADYSADDRRNGLLPPLNLKIIEDALKDQAAQAGLVATLQSKLLTPVASITPGPGTPHAPTASPTVQPSASPTSVKSPTPQPSPTLKVASPTPTRVRVTGRPPTASPTPTIVLPTNTPAPVNTSPPQSQDTDTPVPQQPTDTPPADTQPAPTDTQPPPPPPSNTPCPYPPGCGYP